jgi:hypothetical protein
MKVGRDWLLVEKTIYGRPTYRTRIQDLPTQTKKLEFPIWYPPEVADNTVGFRELEIGSQLRKRNPELVLERVRNKRIKFNEIPEDNVPWEYFYERDEPYDVHFGRLQVFYFKEKTGTEPTVEGERSTSTTQVSNTNIKSCLKQKRKYPPSNNKYRGYWYGLTFPEYIRGQVRRAREKLEREAANQRNKVFEYLINYWVPANTEKHIKKEEIEEEISKIDCLGHLSEEELEELKKKIKIEEE